MTSHINDRSAANTGSIQIQEFKWTPQTGLSDIWIWQSQTKRQHKNTQQDAMAATTSAKALNAVLQTSDSK